MENPNPSVTIKLNCQYWYVLKREREIDTKSSVPNYHLENGSSETNVSSRNYWTGIAEEQRKTSGT